MIKRQIKSAVITGPTGAVGTALCRELLNHDIVVYAVCRPESPRAAALPKHPNLRIVSCDISELEQLHNLISGADAFYHFAWAHTIGPGRNDMPAQIQNIRYTIDAARAAKALGCEVFVGAGSQAEYGRVEGLLMADTPCRPENGYGIAKHCAGLMSRVACNNLGIDHVWVRILSVYGPGDGPATMVSSVIRQLRAGQVPALTEGIQRWDYLYSGDAARALHLIACHGVSGRVYPLGSGEAIPLREYVEQIRDAIDPSLALGFGSVPYGPLQVMHLQADISQLKEDTGFAPATSFSDGIHAVLKSLDSQK